MKSLARNLRVSLIYLIAVILFFHVYFGSFSTALIGPPEDNMQDFWNTWYSQTKLDDNPSGFFYTKDLFYPQGANLVYHNFAYPNLAAMYLVRHVLGLGTETGTLIVLHNFFLLISFLFGAMGAYYLARLFVKNEALALVSGFIFGFSPFHVAHTLHHMSVGAITFVPYFVYCFIRYMHEKKIHLAAMSVVLWALSALSCWYYLFYIGYFVLFYYAFHAVKKRSLLWREMLIPAILITCFTGLMLLPLIIPMIRNTSSSAYTGGHDFFIADLLGFIIFHPYHLLAKIGEPVYSHFKGNLWEMTVYIGLVNAAILLLALFRKYHRRIEHLGLCLACILLFLLLSLGSWLHIGGQMLNIPLPTLLTEYIPFFKNVRTPSRAVIFVYLLTGISVAMIVEYLLTGRKKSVAMAAISCLVLVTVVDFYPSRLESTPVFCPPAYTAVNNNPDGDFGIINLPASYIQNNMYMMYQAACSHQPMANGSISRKLEGSLIDSISLFDLKIQKNELEKRQIKYIFVHKEPLDGNVTRINLDAYKKYYPLIKEDDYIALLKVY